MRLCSFAAVLCLALPAAAQSTLHLVPMPREVRASDIVSLANGIQLNCAAPCDAEDTFAADDLKETLHGRGIDATPAGKAPHVLVVRGNTSLGRQIYADSLGGNSTKPTTLPPAMAAEGYVIIPDKDGIAVAADSASGIFYALQTVKQLIVGSGPAATLQTATIRDWPALKYRGLHDDLSRGPVDTLEFQKKIIRTLAAYKDNLYSPYFEHTQQYAANPLPAPPGGSISADDARVLVAYAARYHVTVVPEQEAFGHLHHDLVWETYQPLAETPHGSVLAPGQPGSLKVIGQMFGELANLYPGPFLHVGADETVDLGLGQTRAAVDAQGLGPVYLNFMQQIDSTLRPLDRKLLFWGDIAENSPDLLKAMPDSFKADTIAISWHYNPSPTGFTKNLGYFRSAGFETWVAPGINNWSKIYPGYDNALLNIQQFTRDGQATGATGQLNTIWYDDGEALASNNWYGILFGAAAAWQPGESSIPAFQANYGAVFHGDQTGKLDEAQREIAAAILLLRTNHLGEGADLVFWADPWAPDQQQNFAYMRPIVHDVRMHAECAITLIAEARAAYPATNPGAPSLPTASSSAKVGSQDPGFMYTQTNMLPSNPTSLRETDAIDAMDLAARRLDFVGLKFQLADEIPAAYARAQAASTSQDRQVRASVIRELSDINGVNGRIQDIKDGYSLLRDMYAQLWLRTNRPYALRPVLEHYDYTIGVWLARMDRARTAQRTWENSRTLPPAAEVGIPAPQPGANVKPNVGQVNW